MTLPDFSKPDIFHASAAAIGPRAVLILGPSGHGKSALALSLMAFGADLIADDRVELSSTDGLPWLSAPADLPNLIEARGVGLLKADPVQGAWAALVVDLGQTELARMPPNRDVSILGAIVPLVHKVDSPHFPAAILQYLRRGRSMA